MNDNLGKAQNIYFFQGTENLSEEDESGSLSNIKQKISDLANVKNVSFLLGAGASSDSIPNMKRMLEALEVKLGVIAVEKPVYFLEAVILEAEQILDIPPDIEVEDENVSIEALKGLYLTIKSNCGANLETILGILYSQRTYLEGIGENNEVNLALINFIEMEIFNQINIDLADVNAEKSLKLYKTLYQKLSLRNKDLSRVNVFTTNNDLLSEKALDYLNVNYNNGFGGGLTRVFNPSRFNFTFSKKIDSTIEKYEPIENMVYLYKLHGSISWHESTENSFFDIKEVPVKFGDERGDKNVLIYPTPLKQNISLGSPYADLIREFQKKLLLPHSVLFIIGYSFSDEHINNIIYQALSANSSISIVIFGDYSATPLFKVNDRRIYKIYGEIEGSKKIHHFDYIVNNFIPDLDTNKDNNLLKDFVVAMNKINKKDIE